ncbi:ATP-dependent nuclease [Magnetovibrio sp.]|uniref:ATP-dependent nuclease n=1 Tax=Magnetovibrio sp. TaxID=2024836 RepID=UPI002F9245CA
MAKAANSDPAPEGKIRKIKISNFRGIGATPVEIEIDDIVVLVGPNNSGKSSILRAYETIMHGSGKNAQLKREDFPNLNVNDDRLPTVIVETLVENDAGVGDQWVDNSDGTFLIQEKFTWTDVNVDPQIYGFLPKEGRWATSDDKPARPFGPANIAKSRRPTPISVHAFQSPEDQAKEVNKVARDILKAKASLYKSEEDNEKTDLEQLIEFVEVFHDNVAESAKFDIAVISQQLSDIIEKVFPGYKVEFKPEAELTKVSPDLFFSASGDLFMGPEDEMLPISRQGSGAQRTLLWAALKVLSQHNETKSARPRLLLIDEPELCLHPKAIREARDTLYNLAHELNWQVMLTTHSPIFIDFTQDHTKVARVERDASGVVNGTTIFRPDSSVFDKDDKDNFKILNLCDPYVAEFFFGGNVILVEGDTEYSAFKLVASELGGDYPNVHIVRARGKATIASLCKVLNQFKTGYSILHDSDTPLAASGNKNPAWAINSNILDVVNAAHDSSKIQLVASITNFETAYLKTENRSDKPYNAVLELREGGEAYEKVAQLLKALIDPAQNLPDGAVRWNDIDKLEKLVKTARS